MVDILQAGSLPMALQDQPVSETLISPDPAAKGRMQTCLLSGLAVLLVAWTVMLVRYDWSGAAAGNTERFGQWYMGMLDRGVYLAPSAFEAGFVSSAHNDDHIEATIAAARESFSRL